MFYFHYTTFTDLISFHRIYTYTYKKLWPKETFTLSFLFLLESFSGTNSMLWFCLLVGLFVVIWAAVTETHMKKMPLKQAYSKPTDYLKQSTALRSNLKKALIIETSTVVLRFPGVPVRRPQRSRTGASGFTDPGQLSSSFCLGTRFYPRLSWWGFFLLLFVCFVFFFLSFFFPCIFKDSNFWQHLKIPRQGDMQKQTIIHLDAVL